MTVEWIHYFSGKMGGTMVFFWITLVIFVIGSNASGELSILHSPDSLKFSGSIKTRESLLKEIFSASLGLSVEENGEWNGLVIVDPFKTPEAVVEVYIDGVSSLGESTGLKTKEFPLIVDEYEPDTFAALRHRIKQRFTNSANKLVNIRLSDPDDLSLVSDVFGEVVPPKLTKQTYQYLKVDNEEVYSFLYELEVLKVLTDKIKSGAISGDNVVDYYNFRFRTLHALSDFYGPNSMETKEAKTLLANALIELSDAFVKAYDGSVLVAAVCTDVAHTRRTVRAAPEFRADKLQEAEDNYTADYAAIFNIILWFSVVFTFALVAIVYAIMDMDPGRDSIIYRMTSTRMKKDN
ncbi:ATPase H(+)-transporting accessory protein 2 [Bicyclus anynana]|uniref:ATPase H(+)-transporting accessory protein 2 n=1 Tax=Bicyclus anynana TaxID=110368 RepID=A0A6J1MPU5_BICAN|nr:ATPase H(+)-transporting accessory protein 2 [Bicyclus anynana]